jgi:hypothetical protein
MCAGRREPQVPWGEVRHLARPAGYIPQTPRRAALFHPSYYRPEKLVARDHNNLSEPNQSLTYFALPQHCTLWTGGIRLVTIRIWLHSASRVGQPPRPVSGVPASPAASQRILASFRHPGKAVSVSQRLPPSQLLSGSKMPPSASMHTVLHGEVLYFQHRQPQFRSPDHPGDASCQKTPPDASPNRDPPPQLIEKEELKTS